jgi:hypothetical protein
MKRQNVFFVVMLGILFSSCQTKGPSEKTVYVNTDSLKGKIIADTIIYDVLIKNPNPEDYWTDECLQYLNKDALLDSIFANIYSGKLIAYDFILGKPYSIKEIEQIENSDWFSRDAVGKIQFTEVWFFDSNNMVMNKKVISLIFGVEQYNSIGELKGHKPLFKIYLN